MWEAPGSNPVYRLWIFDKIDPKTQLLKVQGSNPTAATKFFLPYFPQIFELPRLRGKMSENFQSLIKFKYFMELSFHAPT